MSLIAMDMPDTHAELVDWLERHLVGLDLAALVAELSAIHGRDATSESGSDSTSAMNLLSGQIPEVIENGLAVLDTEQVRALLRHPRSLLELQELVLTAGGAHWEKRMDDTAGSEFQQIADTGWRRMQLAIAPPMSATPNNGQGNLSETGIDASKTSAESAEDAPRTLPVSDARHTRPPRSRFRAVYSAVLGTAAMFLVGAFGLHQAGWLTIQAPQSAAVAKGWGWERPGALPTESSADAYLNSLAHSAGEWFNKRPTEREAIEQRIREFSRGCQTLIEAPHEPLSAEERQWLVEKCKAWRNKLDSHLAASGAGEDPLAVRAAADETIEKLIKAMRTKADDIA